jgi:predicted TPR repeat methyltransferase
MPADIAPACWARQWTRSEMTIEAADAARAMRDAIVARAKDAAARNRLLAGMGTDHSDDLARHAAATLDHFADVIARMEPKPEETGICGRGA